MTLGTEMEEGFLIKKPRRRSPVHRTPLESLMPIEALRRYYIYRGAVKSLRKALKRFSRELAVFIKIF